MSRRGAGQGCMLSPALVSLYTGEGAVRMRLMNAGVSTGYENICTLLYADDVRVMSEST